MSRYDRCSYTHDVSDDDTFSDFDDDEWRCPHYSHSEAEQCIFHLSPDELELTDAEVARRFSWVINGEARDDREVTGGDRQRYINTDLTTEERKQFIGAEFGDLRPPAMELVTLEEFRSHREETPLDLRENAVHGEMDFSHIQIQHSIRVNGSRITNVDFEAATIEDDMMFEQATITSTPDFSRMTIQGSALFNDAEIQGVSHSLFKNTTIEGDTKFRNSDVGRLNFDKAKLGEVDFTNATIGSVRFYQSTVEGVLWLKDAIINGNMGFRGAVFEDSIRGQVDINGRLEFDNADVKNSIRITNSNIENNVSFSGATIRGETPIYGMDDVAMTISLEMSTITGKLKFEEVFVDGNARFGGINVTGKTQFENATIEGDAIFKQAKLGGDALFTEATINGNADFENTKFDAQVLLNQITVTSATFKPILNHTVWSIVDLTGSQVSKGQFSQPDDGEVFYDFTDATVGAIQSHSANRYSYQYLLFNGTQFKGFDFDAEQEKLDAVHWKLYSLLDSGWEALAKAEEFIDARQMARRGTDSLVSHPDIASVISNGEKSIHSALDEFEDFPDEIPLENKAVCDAIEEVASNIDVQETETIPVDLLDPDWYGAMEELAEVLETADIHNADIIAREITDVLEKSADVADAVANGELPVEHLSDEFYVVPNKLPLDNENIRTAIKKLASDITEETKEVVPREKVSSEPLTTALVETNQTKRDIDALLPSPSEKEATQRNAKIAAREAGIDPYAANFYIWEMRNRRSKYAAEALHPDTDDSTVDRVQAAYKWLGNKLLDLTTVYGERTNRVVLVSLGWVGLFAVIYRLLGAPAPTGSGWGDYLLFSFQSFIAFILGGAPQTSSFSIQFASAIEGFTGGFFVALFVFALTRSVQR